MTHAQDRNTTLIDVRDTVKKLFAAHPEYRSALFCVAQYWNDQADDETHSSVLVSTRAVPLWPHVCRWDDVETDADGNTRVDRSEACDRCAYELVDSPYIGVAEWEPYCHEHGSQDQDMSESFLPYALLRRRDDGEVDIEIVGRLQRPANELVSGEPTAAAWPDARARALFDDVCRNPADDGPRTVLSDHLLESPGACDPRGEYIALALAPMLDADGRARRDELLAAHEREWLRPLGGVIPPGCARFERGFLAYAEVYTYGDPPSAVNGSPTWSTVETLRVLPGSADVIEPTMTALRDVGQLGARGLQRLLDAADPWRIERLHLAGSPAALAEQKFPWKSPAAMLPALRHLVVRVEVADTLVTLAATPWWSRLARVTIVGDHGSLVRWQDLHRRLEPLPQLAIASADDRGDPAGWQVVFGPHGTLRVESVGFHAQAGLEALVAMVRELPQGSTIVAASSPYHAFTEDDLAHLADTGRTVTPR